MAAEWYYAKGDKKHGPITAERLRELAESGDILPTDKVWQKGTKGWVRASTLPDLFTDDGPPPLDDPTPQEQDTPIQVVWKYCKAHPVLCAAIGFGVFVLLTLVGRIVLEVVDLNGLIPLFVFPMLLADFVLFVLLIVLGIRHLDQHVPYSLFHGRWNSVDGRSEPLEFSGGNTVTRGDSMMGKFVIHKDKRIEITSGGRVVEVWQLVKVNRWELVFQDATGSIKRFKKKSTNPFAALFNTNRITYLEGSWQPITESNDWIQFTKDGAVVFSDGTAGRYSVVGEEPNQVIEIEMVGGATRQFKIVSLTSGQLVIAEGSEATTFRRPRKVAAKKREAGTSGEATNSEEPAGASGSASSRGLFGSVFSFFTKWKCPKCKQRSAEKVKSEHQGDTQQIVETRYDFETKQSRQMVVNYCTVRLYFRCKECGHEWSELEQRSGVA